MANLKFTLIRVDCDNPNKINLEAGVHVFGRGKLLDVEDKRISRKHGQLEVTDDSLSVKALHQNPCFYKREGSSEIKVLRQDDSICLNHGDQLGLLSGSYWYEVLHLPSNGHITLQDNLPMNAAYGEETDNESESRSEPVNEQRTEGSLLGKDNENMENRDKNVNDQSKEGLLLEKGNENIENRDKNQNDGSKETTVNNKVAQEKESQSSDSTAIDDLDETNFDDAESPSVIAPNEIQQDEQSEVAPTPLQDNTPLKRPLESGEGSSDGPKKGRVDSDVKPEVKTEPTASSSTSNNDKPQPVPVGLRERCMYGSSCYRRNEAHRAQYSHPADADWGAGPQAACPRGAACAKRDPRHWRDHFHPPGVHPPPSGQQVVHKNGNIFYINAHTVNFYDDHFEAEDSDGNSVDYDYEF